MNSKSDFYIPPISKWYIIIFYFFLFQIQSGQFTQYGSLSSPHSTLVVSVVISPDQSFLVTGASQTTLKIWNFTSLALLTSHTYADVVTNINIHQTDHRIFVSLFDGTISILDGTTFTQITSYVYPNSGNSNSLVFLQDQSYYYTGGYDVATPEIHKFNSAAYTQSGAGVATSYTSGNQIIVMDIFDNLVVGPYLALVSNQNTAPFRMIIYNIGTTTSSSFDEATNYLTYTKFSPSGTYVFTSSIDNKFRMYKLNSNSLTYSYLTQYDTSAYGNPYAITCSSESYVLVACGQYLIMLNIKNSQLTFVDSIHLGSSNIFSLHELNYKIVAGSNDGSVKLIEVNYPSEQSYNSLVRTIIIIGVVVFAVIAILSVIIVIYCLKRSGKVQQQSKQMSNIILNSQNIKNNGFQSIRIQQTSNFPITVEGNQLHIV